MEVLSKKFQYDFNSVQLVAYIPDGLIQETANKVVGMDYHLDDEHRDVYFQPPGTTC